MKPQGPREGGNGIPKKVDATTQVFCSSCSLCTRARFSDVRLTKPYLIARLQCSWSSAMSGRSALRTWSSTYSSSWPGSVRQSTVTCDRISLLLETEMLQPLVVPEILSYLHRSSLRIHVAGHNIQAQISGTYYKKEIIWTFPH